MHIEKIGIESLEKVKTAMVKIISKEPWNDVWSEEQLHLYVLELVENRNALPLGLYEDGDLVGISLGRVKHWCDGTEYWIDEFGILPEKQGIGIGTKFLHEIECYLKKHHIFVMVLLTDRSTPAYHFYQKNGWIDKTEQAFLEKRIF